MPETLWTSRIVWHVHDRMHFNGVKFREILGQFTEAIAGANLELEMGDHPEGGFIDTQYEYNLGGPDMESATVKLVHFTDVELDAMQDPPDGRAS